MYDQILIYRSNNAVLMVNILNNILYLYFCHYFIVIKDHNIVEHVFANAYLKYEYLVFLGFYH
jgi:hypothetical protein